MRSESVTSRALALALVILPTVSACERTSGSTPTSPTTTAAPPAPLQTAAPIIRLSGNVDFGDVEVGSDALREFSVCNDGTALLGIWGIVLPEGYWLPWDILGDIGATVSPGGCLPARVFFTPVAFKSYGGTVMIQANQTSGANTFQISGAGSRPPVPRTIFGEGRYLVGIGIAPGRYYSDPTGECGWSRKSTYPPSPGDDIASGQTWFDPGQWVIDVLPSDAVFESEGCGWWGQVPVRVLDSQVIRPGLWAVGAQVSQGRYHANARPGCSWQRLRHFEGTPSGIIESGSTHQSSQVTVSIRSTDVGFVGNEACGPWTRVS